MSVTLNPRKRFVPPPLTEEQQAKLDQMHALNEKWRRKKYDASVIGRPLKARIDPVQVQKIIWRYTEKRENLQKIANRVGCSPQVIKKILKNNGTLVLLTTSTSSDALVLLTTSTGSDALILLTISVGNGTLILQPIKDDLGADCSTNTR